MERGHQLEMEARNSYEIQTSNQVKTVGFCELSEWIGCSPDGFIGDDGLIEIKCKNDVNFLKSLIEPDQIDPAHLWQMQMQMFVTDRKWCDYVVYNPNFENSLIMTRVDRNEEKIEELKAGLKIGNSKIAELLERVQNARK
jgi:exodeoxyribonuclease (lambda-induced)